LAVDPGYPEFVLKMRFAFGRKDAVSMRNLAVARGRYIRALAGIAQQLSALAPACGGPKANWAAKCRGWRPLAIPKISSLETILLWPTTSRIGPVWCCWTRVSRPWLREDCPKTASTRPRRIHPHPRNFRRKRTMVGGTRCGTTMDGRRNQLEPASQ
jgi:hypothetical protein